MIISELLSETEALKRRKGYLVQKSELFSQNPVFERENRIES